MECEKNKNGLWVAQVMIDKVFVVEGYGRTKKEAIEDCKENLKNIIMVH